MSNTRRGLLLKRAHVEQIFPKLTTAQIDRFATHGSIRSSSSEDKIKSFVTKVELSSTIKESIVIQTFNQKAAPLCEYCVW